jgi:hypothetical protein
LPGPLGDELTQVVRRDADRVRFLEQLRVLNLNTKLLRVEGLRSLELLQLGSVCSKAKRQSPETVET